MKLEMTITVDHAGAFSLYENPDEICQSEHILGTLMAERLKEAPKAYNLNVDNPQPGQTFCDHTGQPFVVAE